MKLKICGLNDLGNILEITSLKPDYVGFIFYKKSERYIPSWILQDVIPRIPNTIKKVGVFVDEDIRFVIAMCNLYKLDIVQLHGSESPKYCAILFENKISVIKAFSIDELFDFNKTDVFSPFCSYFLFDTKGKSKGGNGIKFNWELLNNYKYQTPFFLSGGIDLVDSETIKKLSFKRLHAIDVNSKFEIEAGFKDVLKLKKFKKGLINKSKMHYEY